MDAKEKFDSDLKKGKVGEGVLFKKITKYSPNGNWVSYNDFDTDIRSKTEGVIEVKTETSTSYKLAFKYKGQWLPRYQWFCVNYKEKKKNDGKWHGQRAMDSATPKKYISINFRSALVTSPNAFRSSCLD